MTDERYNFLLFKGALAHPVLAFRVARLVRALKYVVDGCGKQGSDLLEAWCQARDEEDKNFSTSEERR